MKFETTNLPKLIAIDVETSGLDRNDDLVSAAISWISDSGEIQADSFWLDPYSDDVGCDEATFKAILEVTLFNTSYDGIVIFHNLDFDLKFLLQRFSVGKSFSTNKICKTVDTLTMSRVSKNNKYISHIDPHKLKCHSLKFLAKEFLGVTHLTFDDAVDGLNIRFADRKKVLQYNQTDAKLTLELYLRFQKTLDRKELEYLDLIEFPQLLNLVHMNWHGVPYNVDEAKKLKDSILEYIELLEASIYEKVGKRFNISSQPDLISALFYNPLLKIEVNGQLRVIEPLYLTDKDQPKVDLDTLKDLKSRLSILPVNSDVVVLINNLMQHAELSKSLSFIENHLGYAKFIGTSYRLFPNFSAEAKSGRLISSKPSLLNVPKAIFKKSDIRDLPDPFAKTLKDSNGKSKSVRWLIDMPDGYSVCSIDINALDLTVITQGAKKYNPNFMWIQFFKKHGGQSIDTHMSVSREIDLKGFESVMGTLLENLKEPHLNYWILKPGEKDIGFIHKATEEHVQIRYPDDSGITASMIDKNRKKSKEVNLSTGYMIGATKLAVRLTRETGQSVSEAEARQMLDNFYEAFPEIRFFQDEIGNLIYDQGYVQSQFGRKYFADVYDDLTEYHRRSNEEYDFICLFGGKYFFIRAKCWNKLNLPVVENLRTLEKNFGFKFDEITHFDELDKYVFRKTNRKMKSRFNRKSEHNPEEDESDYELNRIQLSHEIDRKLAFGSSVSVDASQYLSDMVLNGKYFLPENKILFYRVKLPSPSSMYFKQYKKFNKVIRKFFPMYCQGVAATVASMCLTQVREKIEAEDLDAQVLLFVHDQMDIMVNENAYDEMRGILTLAVETPKQPFEIGLTGKVSAQSKHVT